MMTVAAAARFAAVAVLGALLVSELVVLSNHKHEIQGSFCGLAAWLRSTFELGDVANAWVKWFHHHTNSFVYMQLSCLVAFLADAQSGAEMFTFVVFAHIVKNFSKSFIASPRGFWFCTEGQALSCGGGYSLPSGHSMMSLLTVLYLCLSFPKQRTRLALAGLAFELYTVFEILYLGTHTPTDVIVGFTFALFLFSLVVVWEREPVVTRIKKALTDNVYLLTGVLLVLTAVVYQLELVEEANESVVEHPLEYQQNYEAYCNLKPGTATDNMRNSSAFEKTALLIGLTVALFLRSQFGLTRDGLGISLPARLVRAAIATGFFSYSKAVLKFVLVPHVIPAFAGHYKYLTYLVQPSILLVLLPAVFHLVGLGIYHHAHKRSKLKAL